jgi:hypothetical protein
MPSGLKFSADLLRRRWKKSETDGRVFPGNNLGVSLPIARITFLKKLLSTGGKDGSPQLFNI